MPENPERSEPEEDAAAIVTENYAALTEAQKQCVDLIIACAEISSIARLTLLDRRLLVAPTQLSLAWESARVALHAIDRATI